MRLMQTLLHLKHAFNESGEDVDQLANRPGWLFLVHALND
jgi:hypothetical protein